MKALRSILFYFLSVTLVSSGCAKNALYEENSALSKTLYKSDSFVEVEGISYEHFLSGYFTSIHILSVDPKKHMIIPVRALKKEKGASRETVLSLAHQHGAMAAINGGFWRLNGDPAGALKINDQWFGMATKPRGAIGWSLFNQKVLIDQILTNVLNDEDPLFPAVEVVPASTPPYTALEDWKGLEYIVGGAPVLVRGGALIEDFSSEETLQSFLVNRHSRTAIGIRYNGDRVFVVVDASFWGVVGGMTIKELAQLMLDLGCKEALNLDGGRSSTMVFEGTVVNEPHGRNKENGKNAEAVSDAILIF